MPRITAGPSNVGALLLCAAATAGWFASVLHGGEPSEPGQDARSRHQPVGLAGLELDSLASEAVPSPTFSEADLKLSLVDDHAVLSMNGVEIDRAGFGETHDWIDVSRHLKRGENTIGIHVTNGMGGACGAKVSLRLDKDNRRVTEWEWRKQWMPSEIPCFTEEATFWKFDSAPPGFRRIEIAMTRVDDTMKVEISNSAYTSHHLDATYMGYTKPWKDISKFVLPGENLLTVRIGNEGGGECGGGLSVRVDGEDWNPPTPWYWRKPWAPSEEPCFVRTLVLRVPPA
jgi:hypothetical protein